MNPEALALVESLEKICTLTGTDQIYAPARQLPIVGRLLFMLAEQQARSADKLEQATEHLVELTKQLVRLTWTVVFFTVILIAVGVVQITMIAK